MTRVDHARHNYTYYTLYMHVIYIMHVIMHVVRVYGRTLNVRIYVCVRIRRRRVVLPYAYTRATPYRYYTPCSTVYVGQASLRGGYWYAAALVMII